MLSFLRSGAFQGLDPPALHFCRRFCMQVALKRVAGARPSMRSFFSQVCRFVCPLGLTYLRIKWKMLYVRSLNQVGTSLLFHKKNKSQTHWHRHKYRHRHMRNYEHIHRYTLGSLIVNDGRWTHLMSLGWDTNLSRRCHEGGEDKKSIKVPLIGLLSILHEKLC